MDRKEPNTTELLPLEERIRLARAQELVESGYAIGAALLSISHRVSRLFARRQARNVGDRLAAGD